MRQTWSSVMRPLLSIAAASASGCLMAGNYHSAKTLEKGTSEFGLTFSTSRYESRDPETGKVTAAVLPNLIPELTYHIGVTDDVEVGGRVAIASLGIEGDVKVRIVRADQLHLAIAPAVAYQALVLYEGGTLRLPGILTYELADNLDLNLAAFGSTSRYRRVSNSSGSDFDYYDGALVATGAAIGFDLHTETFSIRPALEFTRYVANFDQPEGTEFHQFNAVNLLVHLGFIGGKEKKQLDRIEHKLDQLAPPPAYPPPGYPPPSPPGPGPATPYPPPPPPP